MKHPYVIKQWAQRYGIPSEAVDALINTMIHEPHIKPVKSDKSEAFVQSQILLEAPVVGARLWRNNVGACMDDRGRLIRYGLCNESKQMNHVCKSSDLVGIKPILITIDMVGSTIGQFVAREVKHPMWSYKGTEHEVGQLNFLSMVIALGGDAQFVNSKGSL